MKLEELNKEDAFMSLEYEGTKAPYDMVLYRYEGNKWYRIAKRSKNGEWSFPKNGKDLGFTLSHLQENIKGITKLINHYDYDNFIVEFFDVFL